MDQINEDMYRVANAILQFPHMGVAKLYVYFESVKRYGDVSDLISKPRTLEIYIPIDDPFADNIINMKFENKMISRQEIFNELERITVESGRS